MCEMCNKVSLHQSSFEYKVNLHKLWLEGDPRGKVFDVDGVYLRGINLSQANLKKATIVNSVFYYRTETSDDLINGPFDYIADRSKLVGTNLSGANLTNTKFNRADLRNVDLSGANLSGVEFKSCDLSGANLSGANLSGANFLSSDLSGAIFSNNVFNGTNIEGNIFSALIDFSVLEKALVNKSLKLDFFSSIQFFIKSFIEKCKRPKLFRIIKNRKSLNKYRSKLKLGIPREDLK